MKRWNIPKQLLGTGGIALVMAGAQGCKHEIAVQPIRVEPIYLTVDVNIRVDEQLAKSFDFEDEIERQMKPATPTTESPATTPSVSTTPGGVS